MSDEIEKKVEELEKSLELLVNVQCSAQSKLLLLQYCCHPRFFHLLRLVRPSLIGNAAAKLDRHIALSTARIANLDEDRVP